MKVDGKPYRTIWLGQDGWSVEIIDQTKLPHLFEIAALRSAGDAARAISTMQVRGAPLIGATAAYGVCLALREDASDDALDRARDELIATRPTAVNLRWALDEIAHAVRNLPRDARVEAAYARAAEICDQDVKTCRAIGEHGLSLIEEHCGPQEWRTGQRADPLQCGLAGDGRLGNRDLAGLPGPQCRDRRCRSGWTRRRPRNQGSALTAFELGQEGVSHTIIVDNAGGHVMQKGDVDLCIVGTDRTAANGDVANKIGTYLKALAARDNGVPFYVALPHSTIDWTLDNGFEIPIEQRDPQEITHVTGRARRWRNRHGRNRGTRQPGRQLCLRRDPGAAGDRLDHRARHLRSQPRGSALALPRKARRVLKGAIATPATRSLASLLLRHPGWGIDGPLRDHMPGSAGTLRECLGTGEPRQIGTGIRRTNSRSRLGTS